MTDLLVDFVAIFWSGWWFWWGCVPEDVLSSGVADFLADFLADFAT